MRVCSWLPSAPHFSECDQRVWGGNVAGGMAGFDDPDAWDPFFEQDAFVDDVVSLPPDLLPEELEVAQVPAAAPARAPVRPPAVVAVSLSPGVAADSPGTFEQTPEPILPARESPVSGRKRLRTKQPDPTMPEPVRQRLSFEEQRPSDSLDGVKTHWRDVHANWHASQWRWKWLFVFRRAMYWLAWMCEDLKQKADPSELEQKVLACGNGQWKRARREVKHEVIRYFLDRSRAPEQVQAFAAEAWPPCGINGTAYVYSRSVMFTWNGEWGQLSVTQAQLNSCFEGVSLSPTGVEKLCEELKKDQRVISLWKDLSTHISVMQIIMQSDDHAFSLEMCTETLRENRQVRLHAHAFYKKGNNMFMAHVQQAKFKFCAPHKSVTVGGVCTNRGTGGFAGMYYCVAPKYGSVLSHSTQKPYREFPVSSQWVFTLIQQQQMLYHAAKRELVTAGKGLTRALGDLERWRQAQQQLQLEEKCKALQTRLRARQKKFRDVPKVQAWLRKWSLCKDDVDRRKILVLTGGTGLGKTAYVKSLFPVGGCLEINAANMKSYNVAGFDPSVHRAILFDEASVHLVLSNRKAFQMPAGFVDVGHSPTGRDIVHLWLNDSVSIVCSNKWEEEVAELTLKSDEEWLRGNCVVYKVETPLWVD